MPKSKPVQVGSFTYDPDRGVLRDAEGAETTLRPQTRHVFQILVNAQGDLVRKDSLMDKVWPDTHVTDDSLVQCISEIRKALGPEDGRMLKTVPKKGYKLVMSPMRAQSEGRWRVAGVVAIALVFVVAVASWFTLRPQASPPLERTVAVLPFANIAAEDTYRYFANGITEDLVVSLSKVPDLHVASRSAASSVAEDMDDPREIARDLQVEYLVDGSVRRSGDNLRMTVALVDGETGGNAWAESYEGSLEDIFSFQDAVLEELVRVLAIRLSAAERERLGIRGTENAMAYDHYLRGMELENFLVPTANLDAVFAFREAIRLDPDYAAAHAYLSLVLSNSAEYGWAEDERAAIEDAIYHGDKAVELAPDNPFVRFARGRLRSRQFVGDLEGSLADFRAAIEVDPNYDDAYAFMANVLVFSGQAEEARQTIRQVLERNPNPPYWYFIPLGISNYYLGDYEAAEAALQTVVERNPNSPHAMRNLIATYGRLGRTDDAEWYMFEYESLGHTATISAIMSSTGKQHEPYREAFSEGLRMAGMPE